tara:strand:- start:238 stop:690 length:453 start_codon:yes stop_codon:yes gene_type:complete
MKYLPSIIIFLGLLGCVTAESVKTISDYDLCLNHSEPKISESVWQVYDDELKSRQSLDCKVHAKRIAEYKERERKRSEAMQEIADRFGEINDQQSGRTSTKSSVTQGQTGYLEEEYVSGFNKICVYSGVSGKFTKTISSVSLCPISAKQD